MNENCRQKDFLWGAVVGGVVATLSALLFTTKKGKQIQKQIGDTYGEIEDSVKNALADSEETAGQLGKKLPPKTKQEDHSKDSK